MKFTLSWLKPLLAGTEAAMILYWVVAGTLCLGLVSIPKEFMYSGYGQPFMESWNWSFMPIDMLFSVIGLISLTPLLKARSRQRAQDVSQALMFCAGLMAIAFWAFARTFDPLWWGVNLWLMALALLGFFASTSVSSKAHS